MDDIESLIPTPGADENQSLGALSRLQSPQQVRQPQNQNDVMRQMLMGDYQAARGGRESARSAMDDYYQKAMDVLKTPVQDNSWLHLALGALEPTMPWGNGVLGGAKAAAAEEARAASLDRDNTILSNKLGGEWQKSRMADFRDEADKLLGQLAGGVGKQAEAKNAFARQASTMYTQQLEGARKQAESMTNLSHEDRNAWIQETARNNTRTALMQLAPIYQQTGIDVSDELLDKFFPQNPSTAPKKETNIAPGAVGILPANLPPEVQAELEKQMARLQANPNNKALRDNTLARMKEIAAQYPQAIPNADDMKRFGIDTAQQFTGDQEKKAAKAAADNSISSVKASAAGMKEKAEVDAKTAEGGAKIMYETFDKIKDLPMTTEMFNDSMKAWSKSQSEFGAGAETLNSMKSFLNNRLGLGLSPEKVADAQEFKAGMGRFAASLLRQTDSQPAQKLYDEILKQVGSLENTPEAIPKILANMHKLSEIQAEGHNNRVRQSIGKGFQPYFDLEVKVPPMIIKFGTDRKTGKRAALYSDGSKRIIED